MEKSRSEARIPQSIAESIAVKQAVLDNPDFLSRIRQAADIITASLRSGGKVHFCGNGGSAADAQHLAAELSGRYGFDRPQYEPDMVNGTPLNRRVEVYVKGVTDQDVSDTLKKLR